MSAYFLVACGSAPAIIRMSNRFITQNNNFARASRFFVHFFTVLARLRRENA